MKKGKKVPIPAPSIVAKEEKPKKKEKVSKKTEDPEFAEFKEIHSRSQKDMIWDNDGIDGSTPRVPAVNKSDNESDTEDPENKVAHKKEISDLEV